MGWAVEKIYVGQKQAKGQAESPTTKERTRLCSTGETDLIWMNNQMSPNWKLIESNLIPLSTLIFPGYKIEQTKKYSNSVYNTFKIWRRICKITKVKEEDIICQIERAWDPDFTPNGIYDIFKTWDGKCLTRFHKMYNEGGMVSFENIAKRCSLPCNNFY